VSDSVAYGMHDQTNAEINGMISSGLDWPAQVRALGQSGHKAMVYTTWLDAPSYGGGSDQESPVAYLASLAGKYGLPLGGENTGGGGLRALSTCVANAKKYSLQGFMWLSGPDLERAIGGLSTRRFLSELASASPRTNSGDR
jgi:hypothetical protein